SRSECERKACAETRFRAGTVGITVQGKDVEVAALPHSRAVVCGEQTGTISARIAQVGIGRPNIAPTPQRNTRRSLNLFGDPFLIAINSKLIEIIRRPLVARANIPDRCNSLKKEPVKSPLAFFSS